MLLREGCLRVIALEGSSNILHLRAELKSCVGRAGCWRAHVQAWLTHLLIPCHLICAADALPSAVPSRPPPALSACCCYAAAHIGTVNSTHRSVACFDDVRSECGVHTTNLQAWRSSMAACDHLLVLKEDALFEGASLKRFNTSVEVALRGRGRLPSKLKMLLLRPCAVGS